jgi:CheY-like chemotaxis protein
LLAGRKLLLADDSVTIQKVIELTFADEGVRVVAFSNGQDAIDRLEEVAPDIVLADVFMPSKSGYEVCEYVKQNEKLKHVPVMLLVGSFEPFDEAEARRVGADDILTKPFQSIRRLIDRVGALVSSPPPVKEVPTAELPKAEDLSADEKLLDAEELEITTADTMPLPEHLQETLEIAQPGFVKKTESREEKMATRTTGMNDESHVESSDVLLDLGEFEPAHAAMAADDFVLDLDMDDALSGEVVAPQPRRSFVEPQVAETMASRAGAQGFSYQPEVQVPSYSEAEVVAYEDQVHEIAQEAEQTYETEPLSPVRQRERTSVTGSSTVSADNLSPEMVDAIARRVVEMMSEKVVQEIAWEVVPDLAELIIKRQLEDKASQTK